MAAMEVPRKPPVCTRAASRQALKDSPRSAKPQASWRLTVSAGHSAFSGDQAGRVAAITEINMPSQGVCAAIPARMEHGICHNCRKESAFCGLVFTSGRKRPVFWCSSCRVNWPASWKASESLVFNDLEAPRERLAKRNNFQRGSRAT